MTGPEPTQFTLGIVGAGLMGGGIAQVSAQAGIRTLIFDMKAGAAVTAKQNLDAIFQRLDDGVLLKRTVELLAQEKIIGWVQGRMEFGPRALGNRSILGDPRSPKLQSVMNLKVKFRESFRPFAPVVRRERVSDYFDLEGDSPYMLLVAPVKERAESVIR